METQESLDDMKRSHELLTSLKIKHETDLELLNVIC